MLLLPCNPFASCQCWYSSVDGTRYCTVKQGEGFPSHSSPPFGSRALISLIKACSVQLQETISLRPFRLLGICNYRLNKNQSSSPCYRYLRFPNMSPTCSTAQQSPGGGRCTTPSAPAAGTATAGRPRTAQTPEAWHPAVSACACSCIRGTLTPSVSPDHRHPPIQASAPQSSEGRAR